MKEDDVMYFKLASISHLMNLLKLHRFKVFGFLDFKLSRIRHLMKNINTNYIYFKYSFLRLFLKESVTNSMNLKANKQFQEAKRRDLLSKI